MWHEDGCGSEWDMPRLAGMRQMQVVEAERCCRDVSPSDSTRRPANSERFAVFFARGSGSELAYMQHTSNQQQRRRPRDIGPNCSLRGALRALRSLCDPQQKFAWTRTCSKKVCYSSQQPCAPALNAANAAMVRMNWHRFLCRPCPKQCWSMLSHSSMNTTTRAAGLSVRAGLG